MLFFFCCSFQLVRPARYIDEELAWFRSMTTRMNERVDALEGRMLMLEESFRLRMEEFQKVMMEEFARMRNPSISEGISSASADENSEFRMAVKKVELPSFDGGDPVGWITRAETYFEIHGSSEDVKIRLAKICMEGATIHWFNLLTETEDNLTWDKLKKMMVDRYGGRRCDNPFEELKDLHQEGDVEEYISEFEFLSSQVNRLPEEQYLGYFVGGLKPEIRVKVRTLNPQNRLQAMKMARDIEVEIRGFRSQRLSDFGRRWTKERDASYHLYERGRTGSGFKSGQRSGFGSTYNPSPNRSSNVTGPVSPKISAQSGSNSHLGGNSNSQNSMGGSSFYHHANSDREGGPRSRGVQHLPYSE